MRKIFLEKINYFKIFKLRKLINIIYNIENELIK